MSNLVVECVEKVSIHFLDKNQVENKKMEIYAFVFLLKLYCSLDKWSLGC